MNARKDRRRHGDACARPVLGRGALGHVNVYIGGAERVGRDAVLIGVRADITDCGAGALFHHVAQFARQLDIALSGHGGNFDGERRTAHARPGEPRRGAHFVIV